MKDMGCPYRQWGWHDGGPDHKCTKDGRRNVCCNDSWADWYQCDEVKAELSDNPIEVTK